MFGTHRRKSFTTIVEQGLFKWVKANKLGYGKEGIIYYIYSDIWRPTKVASLEGTYYFVTFVEIYQDSFSWRYILFCYICWWFTSIGELWYTLWNQKIKCGEFSPHRRKNDRELDCKKDQESLIRKWHRLPQWLSFFWVYKNEANILYFMSKIAKHINRTLLEKACYIIQYWLGK